MNNKGVLNDWRIIIAYPLFLLIDLLLSIRPLASYLFNSFRQKESVANVLGSVYRNQAAVDEELVDIITAPSDHPNALDVFTSVITGVWLSTGAGHGQWVGEQMHSSGVVSRCMTGMAGNREGNRGGLQGCGQQFCSALGAEVHATGTRGV
jgi:hypothetical protein